MGHSVLGSFFKSFRNWVLYHIYIQDIIHTYDTCLLIMFDGQTGLKYVPLIVGLLYQLDQQWQLTVT
jgi:hypothetical protein